MFRRLIFLVFLLGMNCAFLCSNGRAFVWPNGSAPRLRCYTSKAKKPKTFDDWASWRRSKSPSTKRRDGNVTNHDALNSTINEQVIADAVLKDRRLQFEAMRDGNKLRQIDILNRNLQG